MRWPIESLLLSWGSSSLGLSRSSISSVVRVSVVISSVVITVLSSVSSSLVLSGISLVSSAVELSWSVSERLDLLEAGSNDSLSWAAVSNSLQVVLGRLKGEDNSESSIESGLGDLIQTLLLWLEDDGLLNGLDRLDGVQSCNLFSDLFADGEGDRDGLSDSGDGDLLVWVLGSQEQLSSSVDIASSRSISSDSDFVFSWESIILGDGLALVLSLSGGGGSSFCHLE